MLDHTLYTGLAAGQQQINNRQPSIQNQRPVQNSFEPQQPAPQPQRPAYTQPPVYEPQPTYTQQPVYKPQPTSRPQLPSSFENLGSSSERLNEFSSQCGVPKLRPQTSTGLVVNGKAAVKGQVRKI